MTTATRPLSKDIAQQRLHYGNQAFARFQHALHNLNLEKDEYWKNSNFSFLNKIEKKQASELIAPAANNASSAHAAIRARVAEWVTGFNTEPATAIVLTFVNGTLVPEHCQGLGSKQLILETNPELIAKYFTHSLTNFSQTPATAAAPNLMLELNAALAAVKEGSFHETQEVFIRIPQANKLAAPLILLSLDDKGAQDKLIFPRIHLHLETNAALRLIEIHAPTYALLQNSYFNLSLAAGAQCLHIQELCEGTNVNHTHMLHGSLAANSAYTAFSMQQGGQATLLEKCLELQASGAHVDVHGLALAHDRQHFNNIISLHHKSPQTTSSQHYRFILAEHARGAFTGNVVVYRDAQQTHAEQLCKTLLLGEKAVMHTRPQLEIFADDVKCGHGATIGQLAPEEIFYLTSRGISPQAAQTILSTAFAKAFFIALAAALGSTADAAAYVQRLSARVFPTQLAT